MYKGEMCSNKLSAMVFITSHQVVGPGGSKEKDRKVDTVSLEDIARYAHHKENC